MTEGPAGGERMLHFRPATPTDEDFLFDMLYEALYVPEGGEPFPRSILDTAQVARYAADFGHRAGDVGVVAEVDGNRIGAAWVRLPRDGDRGYGYIDEDTPELTVAVKREWRGRGVGTRLCRELIEIVPGMSLSSDVRNPATSLYRRLGFEPIAHDGHSVTMLRRGDRR